jgi:hypothetical protein
VIVSVAAAPLAAQSAPPGEAPASSAGNVTPDDAQMTAIARALFEEGLQFIDSAAWANAADRFSRLLAIRYSAVAAYNLALARSHLGQLVLAAETLQKLLADASLDAKVRGPALSLQADVERKVGSLTVTVEGDASGCILYVDDQAWPRVAWGVAAPMDPGEHVAQLRRGGSVLRSERVKVAPGAGVTTVLSLRPVPPPAAVAAKASATDPSQAPVAAVSPGADEGSGGSVLRNPWFWVGLGAVVVIGVVTGAALAGAPGDEVEPAAAVKGDFNPSVIEGTVQ